jgi:hypothetical protein
MTVEITESGQSIGVENSVSSIKLAINECEHAPVLDILSDISGVRTIGDTISATDEHIDRLFRLLPLLNKPIRGPYSTRKGRKGKWIEIRSMAGGSHKYLFTDDNGDFDEARNLLRY